MTALSKQVRSPHSPSPIYGIRPGFTVGDLDNQYRGAILVYGTYTTGGNLTNGYPTNQWPPTPGQNYPAITQRSTADASGTVVSPHARVVKITINVSGAGTVDVSAKSASDSYSAKIFESGVLSAGTYEFYLGGWSSPTSNSDASYKATQYGPVKYPNSPDHTNTTGDEEPVTTTHADSSADSNYVGGTYNPVDFTSLDGYDLKFFAAITSTVGFDVEVTPVS